MEKIFDDSTVDFYRKKQLSPGRLLSRAIGRKGFKAESVIWAIEHCSRKIRAGKDVKDIEIYAYICNVAKDLEFDKLDFKGAEEAAPPKPLKIDIPKLDVPNVHVTLEDNYRIPFAIAYGTAWVFFLTILYLMVR